MKAGCVFCDYAGPSPVLYEDSGYFVIEPISPVAHGHVLVIPRRHVESAAAAPGVAARTMLLAARWVRDLGLPCNIITSVGAEASQTIMHLHLHVVPRAQGDRLSLPWA
jgi:histidine triad (HIT) family protein